jgi:rhodanese-related sulfurtransferase
MTKKCKIVKIVNDISNDTKIPDWYKKDNNYSLFIDLINKQKKYNPLESKLKKEIPKLTDKKISFELHNVEKNNWFLYWASNSTKKETEIKNSKDAYNDFKNHGLVKSNSEGKCKFILNCPQIYTENNITFPRHIHYTTLNKEKWKKEFKTIIVKCLIDFKKIKFFSEKKSMIIFNALPKKYYDKEHIPNSINLSYKYLKKYSKQEQFTKIKKLIEINLYLYPKIKKLYDLGKIDIKNIPIITYCAHCDCNASDILLNMLNELGFVNILEYPGGMKEWKENNGNIETKETKETKESKTETKTESKVDNKDMFDLNYKLEKLIIDNKEYNHNIHTEEIFIDDKKIGLWDGKKIEHDSKSNTKKLEVKIIKGNYNDKIDELKNTLHKINKNPQKKYSFEKKSNNYGISFF